MKYKPRPTRRNDEDEDEGEDFLDKSQSFQVRQKPLASAYTVQINEPFNNVKQFENVVAVLERAVPGDVMEIKLSTPGGALHAILPLLAAIAGTQAQVFVHAVSDVASAGTFLLMMADDVYINPYVTVMFHQVSFGAFGPGNQVEDRVNFVMRSSTQLLREMYSNFLSEDEIKLMLIGKEFWMDKPEFDARYALRTQIMEAKMAEAMLEVEAPPKKARKKSNKPALPA